MAIRILKKLQALSAFEMAVIISIFIVIILTAYFSVTEKPSEYYTFLYLNPDSIHYSNNSNVNFEYGVVCKEQAATPYELEIYLDDILIKRNTFALLPDGRIEDSETINYNLSSTKGLVTLILYSPVSNYDVHFLIRKESY